MSVVNLLIRQPIRKAWQNDPNGSVFITLPKELSIRDGDYVEFKVVDEKIVLEKMEVSDEV